MVSRPQHSTPWGQVPDRCWMTLSECVIVIVIVIISFSPSSLLLLCIPSPPLISSLLLSSSPVQPPRTLVPRQFAFRQCCSVLHPRHSLLPCISACAIAISVFHFFKAFLFNSRAIRRCEMPRSGIAVLEGAPLETDYAASLSQNPIYFRPKGASDWRDCLFGETAARTAASKKTLLTSFLFANGMHFHAPLDEAEATSTYEGGPGEAMSKTRCESERFLGPVAFLAVPCRV